MPENTGREAVVIARTEAEYDGPGGLARARDAMYLSSFDGYGIGTLNYRHTVPYLTNKGKGYTVNDVLTLKDGTTPRTGAQIKVTSVNAMGGIIDFTISSNTNTSLSAKGYMLQGGTEQTLRSTFQSSGEMQR